MSRRKPTIFGRPPSDRRAFRSFRRRRCGSRSGPSPAAHFASESGVKPRGVRGTSSIDHSSVCCRWKWSVNGERRLLPHCSWSSLTSSPSSGVRRTILLSFFSRLTAFSSLLFGQQKGAPLATKTRVETPDRLFPLCLRTCTWTSASGRRARTSFAPSVDQFRALSSRTNRTSLPIKGEIFMRLLRSTRTRSGAAFRSSGRSTGERDRTKRRAEHETNGFNPWLKFERDLRELPWETA